MDKQPNVEQFFADVKRLIDDWCERKLLSPLSVLLNPYLGFNGLTDGWAEILEALRTLRASYREDLSFAELRKIDDLIRTANSIVYRDISD